MFLKSFVLPCLQGLFANANMPPLLPYVQHFAAYTHANFNVLHVHNTQIHLCVRLCIVSPSLCTAFRWYSLYSSVIKRPSYFGQILASNDETTISDCFWQQQWPKTSLFNAHLFTFRHLSFCPVSCYRQLLLLMRESLVSDNLSECCDIKSNLRLIAL